jgi:sugar phosphate isomerase/epimerase
LIYHSRDIVLLIALSCLQGQSMDDAFDALSSMADGVQLTPGNAPSATARETIARYGVERVRHHHTFAYDALKRPIYTRDGSMQRTLDRWSVHPPLAREHLHYDRWFSLACEASWATEVMYPGEWLGTGAELERAMSARMPLAVDVSHLFIQRCAGAITERTLARVLEYDRVTEVHVSANDGRRDTHQPLTEKTFGLDWARAKLRDEPGTPVVLECYMHKLSIDDRRRQIDLIR